MSIFMGWPPMIDEDKVKGGTFRIIPCVGANGVFFRVQVKRWLRWKYISRNVMLNSSWLSVASYQVFFASSHKATDYLIDRYGPQIDILTWDGANASR